MKITPRVQGIPVPRQMITHRAQQGWDRPSCSVYLFAAIAVVTLCLKVMI